MILLLLFAFQSLGATPLADQFKQAGYVEICDKKPAAFDSLYAHFDELIGFLQMNPVWAQKLHLAKERFIRTKDRNGYSTDFFGLYDESEREGRRQIAFYYSTHFHRFICSQYPEFNRVPEIIGFLEACDEMQKPYGEIFNEAGAEFGLVFSTLFKVIKYLPSYSATRPHYDGTALSLLLDSTDNESLLLSPYKSSFAVDDFSSPQNNSILLIPGTLLTEFSIYPTPHIVVHSGKTRYAAVAFAMRPNYTPPKFIFPSLPHF